MCSAKHPPPAAAAANHAPEQEKVTFQGKYKYVRNEDFEDYLGAIGLSWVSKKIALHTSPSELEIIQEGETITIKFNCITQNKKDLTFTVGHEFEDIQHNGNVVKVSPVWEGNKLVLAIEPKEEGKGKAEKQTRELHEDELIHTYELGDVMARRFFKRIN